MNAQRFADSACDQSAQDVKSYHYSLFLFQTEDDQVFGAFVTAFPAHHPKLKFVGSQQSFLFRVRPSGFE